METSYFILHFIQNIIGQQHKLFGRITEMRGVWNAYFEAAKQLIVM